MWKDKGIKHEYLPELVMLLVTYALCFAIEQLNVTVHCPEYLMFFCTMPQTLRLYFEPTVCGLMWVEVTAALKV